MLIPQLDRADVEIQRERICSWETARHICWFAVFGQGQLNMAEVPEDDDYAADLAELNGTPTPGLRIFPLVVIVLAVFPIALGVGFMMHSSPPPARLAASDEVVTPIPNDIKPAAPDRHLAGPDRSKGDDLLRVGRFEAALQHYRSLGSDDFLRFPTELSIRIGFCQEGLGLWEESLATYRSVASAADEILATSAILGQGRIWMRLNDFETAEPLLRSLVLQSGNHRKVPELAVPEIVLLHSVCVAELGLVGDKNGSSAGLDPVANQIDWSLRDALTWVDAKSEQNAPLSTDPVLEVSIPRDSRRTDDDVDLPEVVHGPDPLSKRLELRAHQQTALIVLDRIAKEAGLELVWTDAVRDRAESRIINAEVHNIPLVLMVSALTREIGGEWRLHQKSITIDGAIENSLGRQREVGTACLIGAMSCYPDQRLSTVATFARAQLATAEGRQEEAASLYSSIIGKTTSPLAIRAAFNAALVYHKLGDLVRTCQSLEIVVHGAPGHELHPRSMILYGRTLMDRGEFREASHQLRRAAGSRHFPEDQARASVFLAMAELFDGRPHEAAEALFAHRLQFQDRTVRNAAALMTSMARWRTSNGPSRERESAFLYRAVVTVEPQSEWLGPTGQLLLGQAMNEVNLEDRMVELFEGALKKGVPKQVEVEMKLCLADYYMTHDRTAEAKSTWTELYGSGGPRSQVAGIRLATLALEEGQPETCLQICQTLQNQPGIARPDLLKLAGKAYEQSGKTILAARCYAGEWPLP